MIRKVALSAMAVLVLAACSGPVRDGSGSGQSPANFSFRSDDQHALATIRAAEEGKPASWQVSATSFGSVTPAAMLYADRGGRSCRGLTQARSQAGDAFNREVTACKGADGLWVVTEYAIDKAD